MTVQIPRKPLLTAWVSRASFGQPGCCRQTGSKPDTPPPADSAVTLGLTQAPDCSLCKATVGPAQAIFLPGQRGQLLEMAQSSEQEMTGA